MGRIDAATSLGRIRSSRGAHRRTGPGRTLGVLTMASKNLSSVSVALSPAMFPAERRSFINPGYGPYPARRRVVLSAIR